MIPKHWILVVALTCPGGPATAQDDGIRPTPDATAFPGWIAAFRDRALAAGIAADTVDAALDGATYQPDIVRRDRNQSEFTKTLWDYLDTAVSDLRVTNGRKALDGNASTLDAIEARHGVEKEVVVAIWGLESSYGAFRGDVPTIPALATLAFDARRADFFEAQLLDALRILGSGDVTAPDMTGSWAGAMGHTQFMPTSYLAHAQDFTGDGRRDIWGDDPADALASTAAYLAAFGWTMGQPWGLEVRLPDGFDYAQTGERVERDAADWMADGVRAVDGGPLPVGERVSIRVPAGHLGAAFATYPNFRVLERYNTADAYVIGVGHLSDRLAGGPPISSDWPRTDRALTFAERVELQTLLREAGFDPGKFDGLVGPNTLAAIRSYQASEGLVPDGYANPDLLARLRG
ncbi:MAG: lytic murein transglycosylase [Jannaschia sp.]